MDGLPGHQQPGLRKGGRHGRYCHRQNGGPHRHKQGVRPLLEKVGKLPLQRNGGEIPRKAHTYMEKGIKLFHRAPHGDAQRHIAHQQRGHGHRILTEKDVAFFSLVPSLFGGCLFCFVALRHRRSPLLPTPFLRGQHRQRFPHGNEHLIFRPQHKFADRRHKQHQQHQSDNDLQLDVDGKHVNLRNDLH
ncbi:hypothetical protein SDC9_112558 [bioreactor metagenome]|uniref:Uncharacterized protein n=1 Tax=bioreactor metagenome TaxID=1076179 RepID=A0A645BMA0_9ZZZZ